MYSSAWAGLNAEKPKRGREGAVEEAENLVDISVLNLLLRQRAHLQVEHLRRELGHMDVFLRQLLGDGDAYRQPVHSLGISQRLHVLGIVGIVIIGGHGAQESEVAHEHALLVIVGNAQRSLDAVHTALPAPLHDLVEESLGDLDVIDKIEIAKAHHLRLPFLIGMVVHDSHDAPYGLLATVGYETLHLGEFKATVLLGIENIADVSVQIRHILTIAGIELFGKRYEVTQRLSPGH